MTIAGLIVVLYALEKKFGTVTKAWQAFSGSSIGKGIFAFIEDSKKRLEEMWTICLLLMIDGNTRNWDMHQLLPLNSFPSLSL